MRAIAVEAVTKVYDHGAGKPRQQYEREREEQARRFGKRYKAGDDPNRGDVFPFSLVSLTRWAAETETAIRAGRWFQHVEAKRTTLADLVDRYRKEFVPNAGLRSTHDRLECLISHQYGLDTSSGFAE